MLDLQPGRASFLAQAQALKPFLLDPPVSLALDPEWKVGPTEVPGGGRIGSSSAAGINDVSVAVRQVPGSLFVNATEPVPTDEEPCRSLRAVYRRLMICQREDGDSAGAMTTYRRCRELLSSVLGRKPAAETEAVRATLA